MSDPACLPDLPPLTGTIRPNAELLALGWQQRFLADPVRAREAEELYRAIGLEVLCAPVRPEDFDERCGDCPALVCRSYVMIYTRPRPSG
jgi:hypothetical protein